MMKNTEICSPLSLSERVVLDRKLDVEVVIDDYKQKYGVDVSRLFVDCDKWLNLYRCKDTNYKFFHPFTVAGDSLFYEEVLANQPYYCLLYTSPSPRDRTRSRMPSSA